MGQAGFQKLGLNGHSARAAPTSASDNVSDARGWIASRKSRHPTNAVAPDILGLASGVFRAEFAIAELLPISYQNIGGRNGESH